jgi:hypothetical protein
MFGSGVSESEQKETSLQLLLGLRAGNITVQTALWRTEAAVVGGVQWSSVRTERVL